MGSLRSPQKICIKVKKYLHEMELEVIRYYFDLLTYLFIICILLSNDDSKIYICKYIIQAKCIAEFIQCMINVKTLKYDIMFHHALTILLVQASVHCEYNADIYDLKSVNYITRTLISTEVSALFLTVHNLLKHIYWTDTVLYVINRSVFIITFLYYRTYRLFNLSIFVFKNKEHIFFLNKPTVFDSDIYMTLMKINSLIAMECLVGIVILNLNWSTVLIDRLYSVIRLNIRYYN